MAKKKKRTAPEPRERLVPRDDRADAQPFDEDELLQDPALQKALELMAERVCDYCEAPVQWMDPADLEDAEPDTFAQLVHRYGINPEEIILSWECTECGNFSISGDDFEVQWLDQPPQCLECDSYDVAVLDPAQLFHLDKEQYLATKRAVGAAVLLRGDVVHCRECAAAHWAPNPADLQGSPDPFAP